MGIYKARYYDYTGGINSFVGRKISCFWSNGLNHPIFYQHMAAGELPVEVIHRGYQQGIINQYPVHPISLIIPEIAVNCECFSIAQSFSGPAPGIRDRSGYPSSQPAPPPG